MCVLAAPLLDSRTVFSAVSPQGADLAVRHGGKGGVQPQVDEPDPPGGVKEKHRTGRGGGAARTHTVEILDFGGNETAYWQILYDRIPTLPLSLHRDFGVISHLWQNIAHRVARTGKR